VLLYLLFCAVASAYECSFSDTNTGVIYNFASLGSEYGYQITDNEGGNFYLNLCGAVVNAPSKCSTSAVCMVNGDKVYSLGDVSSISTYSLDNATAVIALLFSNGDYDGAKQTTRSAQINFVCDEHAFGNDASDIQFLSRDMTSDIWYFQWSTSLVCQQNTPGNYTGASSSTDPFAVALMVVVPTMCCVIVMLSVCLCVFCQRRSKASRGECHLDTAPLLPTSAPAASAPEQPALPAGYFWAWNGSAYQAVPVMNSQIQNEPFYAMAPKN